MACEVRKLAGAADIRMTNSPASWFETHASGVLLTTREKYLILRSALARVSKDGPEDVKHTSASPQRNRARVMHELFAPKSEGAGNAGCISASAASRAKKKHTSVVTTVTPVSPGIPRANGFNGLFRALPGDRAFLPPSPP